MVRALTVPLLYCLLLGGAWSVFFKKKFADSLAPALMLHIIIVMLGGMFVHRLSAGVWGGLALFAGALAYKAWKAPQELRASLKTSWADGVFVFTLLYLFYFLADGGKRFIYWDDYSHWGMFVKESLRLDALYAESPLPFRHKDYVPAATLVEVIWCRLCGRFSEGNVFRALHVFMFSMMLPLCACGSARKAGNAQRAPWWALQQAVAAFFVAVVLQVLFTYGNLHFFHMAHVDSALGVVFFYCFMAAYRASEGEGAYWTLVLALGLATLVLLKQTGIALLPMAFAWYVAVRWRAPGGRPGCAGIFAVLLVPLLLWGSFVVFASDFEDRFVRYERASMQSYGTVHWDFVSSVFGGDFSGALGFLRELGGAFAKALFARGLLSVSHASYAVIVAAAAAAAFVVARFAGNQDAGSADGARRASLAGWYILCFGALYAALVYALYVVAFPAERALFLSSYGRYMSTIATSALLAAFFVYCESGLWQKYAVMNCLAVAAVALRLFTGVAGVPAEIFAFKDASAVAYEENIARRIAAAVPEGESICIAHAWERIGFQRLRFYLHPRAINKGDEDAATPALLQKCVQEHDWLYVHEMDEKFRDGFAAIFENPDALKGTTLYKAHNPAGGAIRLVEKLHAGP